MTTPGQAAKPLAARSIADLTGGTILATVDIAAPPERVFRALTTDEVTRWWGSDELYRTTSFTGDLRPGGRWRCEGKGSDGNPFAVEGEYLEVDPPRTLVQTWKPDWDAGHTTTVTYRLEPTPTGTRVTVRHEGFAGRAAACQGHTIGWERVLGWLDHHAAPRAALRMFLCRLLPPRPTFPADMTPDERALMGEHFVYWNALLEARTAIAYGPVLDPRGAWGLSLVRAADEAAARAIQAADPVIRAERGFGSEIFAMPDAVAAG